MSRGLKVASGMVLLAALMAQAGAAAGQGSGSAGPGPSEVAASESMVRSDGRTSVPAREVAQATSSFPGTGVPAVAGREGAATGAPIGPPVSAPGAIESIIGPDSRTLVSPTTAFPVRAVALITFSAGRCSGWMIGPDTVATAGHCVAPGGTSTFYGAASYTVAPGANGAARPFGSCGALWLASSSGWVNGGDERFDYGVVKLNCTVGNSTGWFGFFWKTGTFDGASSSINGYPGDKPLTQWKSVDQIRVTGDNMLYYANDTIGGMSGSGVYRYRPAGSPYCTGFCVMAIHTRGLHGSFPHSVYNHGTRITQARFNNLVAWRNATT